MQTEVIVAAIIGAVSGLIGAGLGAFFSYRIAVKQIRANLVSANRQAWINELRECLSELQSRITFVSILQSVPETGDLEDVKSSMSRIAFLTHKLTLLINPKEEDHAQLLSLVKEIKGIAVRGGKPPQEKMDAITSLSQKILKREWERVKKGD